MSEEKTLSYAVRNNGIILEIDGNWDNFCIDNNSPHLLKDSIIGKELFSFILGEGVIDIYSAIHEKLLKNPGYIVKFDYRCDSSKIKRFMKMDISSENGLIRYKSETIREEKFSKEISIDYSFNGNNELVRMCAWCKNVKYPLFSEVWHPIEDIFKIAPESFSITHGICSDCYEKVKKIIT